MSYSDDEFVHFFECYLNWGMDLGSARNFVDFYTIHIAKNVGYSFDMYKNKTIFFLVIFIFLRIL